MSSLKDFSDAVRDGQDSTERHTFNEMTFGSGGATVAVKGNGTEDDDCVVLALGGAIMHLPKGTNAEVILLSGGGDNNAKFALVVGPRDKQYASQPGEAWTQDPMDPNKRIGFTANGVRIVGTQSGTIAIGDNGAVEVDKDGNVWLRGQVYVERPIIQQTKAFTS
ncbi:MULTISPECIES: hypothetical protein [Methylosinus]|uniref:Baseplate assembly protein n=1 Tax=Methylosinus trichosporium (strain ATCC 35070 / NCIMB 11131 / UNIQEM 75 / OB3b) TaxID=595536 RepID=A0A2D2CYV5_METT3|nr:MULTISPECIES: hypothetical protein [Methylosinus]ATQ67917.1 hypothetical protein CQW49_08475 [Methylosinus trichosporium OB3b]OBS54008.1 hypothetical protein A8B73_02840 [Methylosinus sp. 3S-1]